MSYKVPAGWQSYGVSADQSTFALPGHTPQNPRLAIFDRKTPQITAGGVSVPSYRVRVIEGVSDPVSGLPLQTRCTVDATIRWPNSAAPSKVKALAEILGLVLSDDVFQASAIDLQLLPTEVASA